MNISVVICTYNRPERLIAAIKSCLRQSVLPIEIIIVDDGNNAKEFIFPLSELAKTKGVPIRYIQKKCNNRGLTKSRNIGWKLAKGDVIQFLDDDAELPERGLEFVSKAFEYDENNELLAVDFPIDEQKLSYTGRRLIEFCYRLAGLWRVGLRFRRCRQLPANIKELSYLKPLRFLQGGSMAIRRQALEDIAGFDENLGIACVGEDKDISIRLDKIGCLGRITSLYVKHYSEAIGRISAYEYGCETGFNYLYINCKLGKLGVGEWLLIGYNIVILIGTEILFACIGNKKFHIEQIKGILSGVYRFIIYRSILKICRHQNK